MGSLDGVELGIEEMWRVIEVHVRHGGDGGV